jgi:hypothetical protein
LGGLLQEVGVCLDELVFVFGVVEVGDRELQAVDGFAFELGGETGLGGLTNGLGGF